MSETLGEEEREKKKPRRRWLSKQKHASMKSNQSHPQRSNGLPFIHLNEKLKLTLYSSNQTCASLKELCVMVSWPSGEPYGRLFRKMCPTLEQGMMKSLPPHIQIWSEAKYILIVASQCYEINVWISMKLIFIKQVFVRLSKMFYLIRYSHSKRRQRVYFLKLFSWFKRN